ncbi:hypothetical protein E5C33_15485 [Stenotrophomonas maltophilia]|uniref:hypothetical protein n=1 Tax=Stenotrophomonas maltophilia TaxID=40324 RepID=UPI001076BB43|nr:hypothetical protein [Stenotrophomonas maltophilia]TFZ44190.1 hypothetical protein E5C33_15485 [Stenotrophomonas maltophilia]
MLSAEQIHLPEVSSKIDFTDCGQNDATDTFPIAVQRNPTLLAASNHMASQPTLAELLILSQRHYLGDTKHKCNQDLGRAQQFRQVKIQIRPQVI